MTAPALDLGGVVVATTLPFREDASAPAGLAVDYDAYAAHCDWLMSNGCRGVGPNGSLGEYSSLTDEERRKVVQVAVETVGDRGIVVAGVHGVGWHQAKKWAEIAAEDGADGVLLLPPTIYRASDDEVVEHYARVDEVGLPIMAYNNPFDTKVDLTPQLLQRLDALENVVAIKEFSGDIRRVTEIQDLTGLDVIAGADDLLLESLIMGAVGWFAGYPNAFPREAVGAVRARDERPHRGGEGAVQAPRARLPLGLTHRVRAGHQAVDRRGRREHGRPHASAARAAARRHRGAGHARHAPRARPPRRAMIEA